MTHLKRITIMVAAVLLLAACKKEDRSKTGQDLQLTTQTRATVTNTWDGGEQVMVSIDNAAAVAFTAAANGVLTPNSPIYWTSATQTITARAWYPDGWSFAADQSTVAKQQAADFIFAPTVSIAYANRATTPLVFAHQTAKVTVNLTNGTAISAADVTGATVSFYGYTAGTANTATGAITGSANGNITPLRTANTCTALLIPQDMTAAQFIKITIAGNDYYYRPAAGDAVLEAGKSYTYNITVNKTALTVEVVSNGATWGTGSASDITPTLTEIRIYTVADMQKIGNDANWTLSKNYILMADLTLNNWTPIGTGTNTFSGTFDGNGHTLTMGGTMTAIGGYVGVFARLGPAGMVKNLKVAGAINVPGDFVYLGAIAAYNYGVIQNCVSTADITATNTITNDIQVGGIVGYARDNSGAAVKNCYTTGNISATHNISNINYVVRAGGIAGLAPGMTVTNCYASGNVSVTKGANTQVYIGGISGHGVPVNCVALNSAVSYTNNAGNYYPGRVYGYENNGNTATNYANSGMSITNGPFTTANCSGTGITATEWSVDTWWSGTATFSFGSTDAAPWVFNDGSRARPIKLYWE